LNTEGTVEIDRIDHFVLTARDVDATSAFYTRVLGMREVSFGDGRRALHFGRQKINLQQAGNEASLVARTPTPGSVDVCFITTTPIDAVVAHLQACGVALEDGPVQRDGAVGRMDSVYFRDPDGNLVEVSRYHDRAD
jgi:catechol 2,3-dioxygenase-like lactoylglutathione lyase family enzyme